MTELSWLPSASIQTLRRRAQCIQRIRQFFQVRGYLEVETPYMASHGVTDVYLSAIQAQFRNQTYFLQTSPEYHMKRLLAAGSGPIFQLARVFRDDELGRWHNPEFTLLEWYQLSIDHHQLMDEMDAFLQEILHCAPMVRMTYQQAFLDACGLDPFSVDLAMLQNTLARFDLGNVLAVNEQDRDQYLFLLMSHVVEPYLARQTAPVAVYHFPPSQAALAQVNDGVAERFEVYYRGVELANGFHELSDAAVQRARFEDDVKQRTLLGLPLTEPCPYLLAALESELPECSGVALGVDRLLALLDDASDISGVMAFDFGRA